MIDRCGVSHNAISRESNCRPWRFWHSQLTISADRRDLVRLLPADAFLFILQVISGVFSIRS